MKNTILCLIAVLTFGLALWLLIWALGVVVFP